MRPSGYTARHSISIVAGSATTASRRHRTSRCWAASLVKEERIDEAADVLRQALAIQERVYGPDHPQVASTLNEIGSVALCGKRLDDAEAAYRRMLDIYRKVYGDNHYLIAVAMSNLSTVAMRRGTSQRPSDMMHEVVARFTSSLSPEHMSTGIARIKLGRTLVKQQKWSTGAAESRAGYEILVKQKAQQQVWLKMAREDLRRRLQPPLATA